MKGLEYVKSQIVKLKDDLQHYTMVEKDSALASQIKYDLEHFETIEKELKQRENLATMCDELAELVGLKDKDYLELKEVIKKALEKGKEDEKMVGIFKNALTIEHHDLPMVDPHDDNENFVAYAFKTLTTIRQNELDKSLRQALREWVLKNAFPKELKAFEIIKNSGYISIDKMLSQNYITRKEYDLLKEVLVCH